MTTAGGPDADAVGPVLIIDDHRIARRGLASLLLERYPQVEIVEATTGSEGLRLAAAHRPRVVLLDMHMPDSPPPKDVCEQLVGLLPDVAIVVVTGFARNSELRDCLRAGARGCLLKDSSEVDLAAAVGAVAGGATFIDPRVAQRLAEDLVGAAGGGPHVTGRESSVLHLLAAGCSNREVAERLMLSEATVKGYVSDLLAKFQVRSRLALVARARDLGLL